MLTVYRTVHFLYTAFLCTTFLIPQSAFYLPYSAKICNS